ncbi:MAG TPA: TetR/AcrR family transcriptional regulator [Thermoanaerobaculia bacterium]|nr:TetR/AcrR family transcriptional regulator [Thermoanaerobaculia bacterium]
MRVIARKGMSAATMQEIAEEAGVAKGTIYLYFRDRDELVEKTFETAITQLISRVEQAMDAEDSLETKIRAAMSAKFAFFRENREFFRLYISLRLPEGDPQQQRRHKRMCQPQYQSSVCRFAGILAEAMDRQEIRRFDPQRLALFIIEGSNAIVVERVMEESPPPEEDDVEFVTQMILGGIRPQRSRV